MFVPNKQISAGQPEWAAEDAAQHALNLANWRIKLLQVCPLSAIAQFTMRAHTPPPDPTNSTAANKVCRGLLRNHTATCQAHLINMYKEKFVEKTILLSDDVDVHRPRKCRRSLPRR
jgi:hypothetical protein